MSFVIRPPAELPTYPGSKTITGSLTLGSHLLFTTDNSVDIGASGATRPRSLYLGTGLGIGGNIDLSSFLIHATKDGTGEIMLSSAADSATAGGFYEIRFSRGTHGSRSIVQNGDRIGGYDFGGWDTAAYQAAARIAAFVDGAPAAGDMPGRLSFWTTPDGSTTLAERWRITNAGHLLAGADDTYDIGAAAATRPANLFLSKNVCLAGGVVGTDGVGVVVLKNGTVPSTSPADTVQLFSADITAGNASLGLRTETAVAAEVIADSTHTLSVRINGTVYKVLLST